MAEATTDISYLQSRLSQLGLTEPPVVNLLPYYEAVWTETQRRDMDETAITTLQAQPWFWQDENGNIQILYLNPDGTRTIYRGDAKWGKHYTRARLAPANVRNDNKYSQPPKSGVHLYFTTNIINAIAAGTKIATLVLVEGEFKAFAGNQNGLYIIGLPSIWGFKEKEANELHPDLQLTIDRCQPDNVIILHDADALQIKWAEWNENPAKDLGKRLNSFATCVLKFREIVKPQAETCDFYYCHLNESLLLQKDANGNTVKGLDDLFFALPQQTPDAVKQLNGIEPGGLFSFINLQAASAAKIKEYFLIKKGKRGEPSAFFQKFQAQLGDRPFVFEGNTFKYDEHSDLLLYVKHKDADKFLRIGCDYYKQIFTPDQFGIMVREMKPWKKGEITEDYINGQGLNNFINDIPKFDSACNVPSHTNFIPIIGNSYNLYFPVTHTIEPGGWPTIAYYLHHVSGPEYYEFLLDYIKLLWERPTQKLPAIALVSEAQGTGKSLFLEFLRLIFCENAIMIGNQEISDRFNSDYATKLVIGIDEGLIEKRAVYEKIKSWMVNPKIQVDQKNVSRLTVDFFAKIIILTNNTRNFVMLEEEDRRFFIRELKKPEKKDPKLLDKMANEIGHFLHYLVNRDLHYPEADQLYFDREVYATEEKRIVQRNSKSWLEQSMRTILPELFFKYNTKVMHLTIKEVYQELKEGGGNYQLKDIREWLVKQGIVQKNTSISRAYIPGAGGFTNDRQRYWEFNAPEWLTEAEMAEFFTEVKGTDVSPLVEHTAVQTSLTDKF